MTTEGKKSVGPFAFLLELEFLDRLGEVVRNQQAKSVSAIIRTALAQYDFADVMFVRPAQVQVAVRLPLEIRRSLKKVARTKQTSIGQLVRAAVEAYLPQLEAAGPTELLASAAEATPAVNPVPLAEGAENLPQLSIVAAPVAIEAAPASVSQKKPRRVARKKRRSLPRKKVRPMTRKRRR